MKKKKAEPVTSAKKNALRRQKIKFEKQIEILQDEVNELKNANKTTPRRLKEEPNLVSRSLWSHLSPSTNRCVFGVNIHQRSSSGLNKLRAR